MAEGEATFVASGPRTVFQAPRTTLFSLSGHVMPSVLCLPNPNRLLTPTDWGSTCALDGGAPAAVPL